MTLLGATSKTSLLELNHFWTSQANAH